ncbi:MAG: MerR family transcriptional regulator [Myxococcota bacterium]
MSQTIPDKAFFKIGEVARLVGVPPYVLRYWETEFDTLRPEKSRTNQRVYRRQDVEKLVHIKRLLYEEGFTIAGARKILRGRGAGAKAQEKGASEGRGVDEKMRRSLLRVRDDVKGILALLDANAVIDGGGEEE